MKSTSCSIVIARLIGLVLLAFGIVTIWVHGDWRLALGAIVFGLALSILD